MHNPYAFGIYILWVYGIRIRYNLYLYILCDFKIDL